MSRNIEYRIPNPHQKCSSCWKCTKQVTERITLWLFEMLSVLQARLDGRNSTSVAKGLSHFLKNNLGYKLKG